MRMSHVPLPRGCPPPPEPPRRDTDRPLKRASPLLLLAVAACSPGSEEPRRATGTASAPVPAPSTAQPASASELIARAVCDHYWKSTSAAARPYDSLASCVAAETKSRPCDASQAQACADFARSLPAGGGGKGLLGSPHCAACLAPAPAPGASVQDPLAAQRAALEGATLTVHSAKEHAGVWPVDLQPQRKPSSMLVKVDIELSGYGYRIDPDDFVLVDAKREIVGDSPYTERLTRKGAPIAWTDPSVRDDPDLRLLAYFVVPTSLRGKTLTVDYGGKLSRPFELR